MWLSAKRNDQYIGNMVISVTNCKGNDQCTEDRVSPLFNISASTYLKNMECSAGL